MPFIDHGRIAWMRAGLACLFMLLLAAASPAAEPNDAAALRKDRCPVCGMSVSMFADWNATIVFADSTVAVVDGPKDMFKYYLNRNTYNPSKAENKVSAITVKDYYSLASIDARKAYFVIWSDVYGPMGHEPIPFEKEGDAKKFREEHKGRKIVRFEDITPKLLLSLDNP